MFSNRELIASIHNEETLQLALAHPEIQHLFLLYGDIVHTTEVVKRIHSANKQVYVHVDFIKGLLTDAKGLEYVVRVMEPDGIISTRGKVIQQAKQHHLKTIQRLFLVDSGAYKTGVKNVKMSDPDAVEAMPGLMPRVIGDLAKEIELPIVAGGLFQAKEELDAALDAGAVAVSAGNPKLW